MDNPFKTIDSRLTNIENLLLSIKHEKPLEPDNRPLTIEDAASFTGSAISTIRKAFREKRLKGYRQAGRLYFFEEDLVRWIKS